ncbi:hypothetical protein AAVH_20569 [Aphelenchoides avenae]|nr:hypothetical protein AAVH_20569 [Aphelenchus avenae]
MDAVCLLADTYARDSLLHTALFLSLSICLATVVLLGVIVARRRYCRVVVHNNLKILLLNAMSMYFMVAVSLVFAYARQLIMFATYKSPCELLVSPTMIVVVRGINFTYTYWFPLWHLAVSDVRRARLGYRSSGGWSCAASYVGYLIYLAYQDETFRSGSPFISLTTKTNASTILASNFVIVGIDIVSLMIDLLITFTNRRQMQRVYATYALGHSYQINENVVVTTRLILPLDICNAALYIAATSLGIAIRERKAQFEPHRFQALLELAVSISWLQLPASLLIFIRFSSLSKRTAVIVDQQSASDIFFEQFRKQIGTMDGRPRAIASV